MFDEGARGFQGRDFRDRPHLENVACPLMTRHRSAVGAIGRLGFAFGNSGFSLLFLCNLEGFHRDFPGRLHACEGPITATCGHSQSGSGQSGGDEKNFHGFHLGFLK